MTDWQRVKPFEWRAVHKGRTLYIRVGAPTHFCFCEGEYIGCTKNLEDAKERCMTAKKTTTAADELEDTAAQYAALKPKPKLDWHPSTTSKDQFEAVLEGEKVPARIRKLDSKTFVCYRDSRYLGAEQTLETAKMRIALNKVSERNRVQTLWEQNHPGELPPFLHLTDAEREEYWRRNPPTRGAGKGPGGVPTPRERRREVKAAASTAKAGLIEDAGGVAAGAEGKRAQRSPKGAAVPPGAVLGRADTRPNPKKPGSSAAARWSKLFEHCEKGSTVAAYVKDGGNPETLENAIKQGYVKAEEK